MEMNARVVVLRTTGNQLLADAMRQAALAPELQRGVREALKENERLRMENRVLKARLREEKAINRQHAREHVNAYGKLLEDGAQVRQLREYRCSMLVAAISSAVVLTMLVTVLAIL